MAGRLSLSDDLPVRAVSARRTPQLETLPGMEPVGVAPVLAERALTVEQEQAVARRSEPLLVAAAAGSGKTSVLVERFVRAVREDGLAPGRMLAITFTERAAGELRERVRARLLQLGERQAARDTEAAFVGTFHGFCARLLRAHPLAVGLDPDFAVLDEGLAGRLRLRALEQSLRELLAEGSGETADLLAAYSVDRVGAMVQQVYLELRSRGQALPRLPAPVLGGDAGEEDLEAASICVLLDRLLRHFGLAYERLKQARSAVDFDDLELLAQELLAEHKAVRAAWAERFELLMVDEFQDTNPRQLAILRALDRGNLFTVGDEFQSIYGFRHADVSLFRARRSELDTGGGSLPLSRNFRSRAPLLEVVNAVFGERFVDFPGLVAGREETAPPGIDPLGRGVAPSDRGAPGNGEGAATEPAVELLLSDVEGWEQHEQLAGRVADGLPPAQLWRQAEARALAQRVDELVRSGRAQAGEIVVLLRASGDLEVFERALQLRGLRTLAAVGAFWGHQQIGDLLAYLRALLNPLDEQALYGVLASPLGGCSRDCLALLAQAAQETRRGVWEIASDAGLRSRLAAGDRDALAAIVDLLARERLIASRHTIAALIQRAISACGYREQVLALDWGERRLANVHKLLRLANDFEASEGRDLRGFLDHVEYLRSAATIEPDAPVEGSEPDAVRLMTVHAAKGLEFSVVCLADLGRLPNARTPDLLVDTERIGVRLMRLDGASSTPALAYEELSAERRAREAQEEDRILYVAMTRAQELLVLSASVDFGRWPRQGPSSAPISWLGLALSEELPALLATREAVSFDLAVGSGEAATVHCRLNSPGAPSLGDLLAPGPPPLAAAATGGAAAARRRQAPSEQPRSSAPTRISTLSYSSLAELERCGYRYYLERVLGIGEDRSASRGLSGEQGLEARARGTLVHRLMELHDFSTPGTVNAAEVGERARELGLRVGEDEREELAALVTGSFQAEPARRVAAARAVRREHPFAFSLGSSEPLINGVIDLLAVEPDGASLVLDYKSDRVGADLDLAALVEREYSIQRLLYALAVLRDGAPAVEIVHWFLEPRQWVSARYGAADRLELEEQLAERIVRARERSFAVSPQPHRGLCLTCPGRAGLCSWGEAETLREQP